MELPAEVVYSPIDSHPDTRPLRCDDNYIIIFYFGKETWLGPSVLPQEDIPCPASLCHRKAKDVTWWSDAQVEPRSIVARINRINDNMGFCLSPICPNPDAVSEQEWGACSR